MEQDPRKQFSRTGLDTLRLSDKQWAAVLTELEAQTPAFDGRNRRREARLRYKKVLRVIIRVAHPGGSQMTFSVRTRDISEMGLGFIHGSFLYPTTPCMAIMPTLDGKMIGIKGHVVRCRLLSGKLHEVGVEFVEHLDLAQFIKNLPTEPAKEAVPEASIFRDQKPLITN